MRPTYIRLISLAALGSLMLIGCNSHPSQKNTATATSAAKPTVALVLGGGAAKGFAHVGVIEALEAQGIRPDLIVGTSAGAMVGAIYASGKSAQQLSALAHNFNAHELIDFTPSNQGLLAGNHLYHYMHTHTNGKPIEHLPIRFAAVATEMHTGQATALTTGDTALAVQASASIPKLFIPPRIPKDYGTKYVDGGQSALVPARIARQLGADVVIAVDVMADASEPPATKPQTPTNTPQATTLSIQSSPQGYQIRLGELSFALPVDFNKLPIERPKELPNNFSITLPSDIIALTQNPASIWQRLSQYQGKMSADDIAATDVLIKPKLAHISPVDTKASIDAIRQGKSATLAAMPQIHKAIQDATHKKSTPTPLH